MHTLRKLRTAVVVAACLAMVAAPLMAGHIIKFTTIFPGYTDAELDGTIGISFHSGPIDVRENTKDGHMHFKGNSGPIVRNSAGVEVTYRNLSGAVLGVDPGIHVHKYEISNNTAGGIFDHNDNAYVRGHN